MVVTVVVDVADVVIALTVIPDPDTVVPTVELDAEIVVDEDVTGTWKVSLTNGYTVTSSVFDDPGLTFFLVCAAPGVGL